MYSLLEVRGHRRTRATITNKQQQWCPAVTIPITINQKGRGRGYHHTGTLTSQSVLPRTLHSGGRVPAQRVVVQLPGGASHRRTRASTTAAVVSAASISITINLRGGGRGCHHTGPSPHISVRLLRALHSGGRVPSRELMRSDLKVASNRRSRATTTTAAVVSYISSGNINHHQSERRG